MKEENVVFLEKYIALSTMRPYEKKRGKSRWPMSRLINLPRSLWIFVSLSLDLYITEA